MPDTQPDPTSGSVPHAFRIAVAWRWAPKLPRPLRGAFLTTLYALTSLTDPAGRTRFRDGKPVRMRDIAAAVGSDEKDVRRYLSAGIAAGVLGTDQEPRRGRSTVYTLILSPRPNWAAAEAVLANSARERKRPTPPPPWREDGPVDHTAQHPSRASEFGGPTPEPAHAPAPASTGDRPPFSTETRTGDRPPLEFGGPTPFEFGGPPPEQHRETQERPQEMADVEPQPSVAREDQHDTPAPDRPELGGEPPPLRPVPSPPPGARRGRAPAVPDGQAPILLPVPTPPALAVTATDVHRHGWRQAFALVHADTGT